MRRIAMRERQDGRATAERFGFRFHTIDGAPYGDESACYAFTLQQVEDDIEAPTAELHAMALDLVADVVGSEEAMQHLAIPEAYRDWIADSWRVASPHLYGRMDFSYDGRGPAKLLELNYDTPTSLYEALELRGLRPTWAEDSINADVCQADEAAHLEVEPGSAVLRHSRRALHGEKAVEVSRSVFRADKYTLWVQIGQDY
jgi:glutathionylspermidine synthase